MQLKARKNGIYARCVKRIVDLFFSLIALMVLSPVMIITAIIVRAKLGSPVLFKQERPGLNGRVFTMYKFRSMTSEKDASGNLLSDEIRLTGFGKKLRSTSLDELPELLNVIKGDMSLVGPRPLMISYLELYSDEQKRRHDVRPGITGLAQVNGRNALTWTRRFEYDVEYVNNISFLLDISIIAKTIGTIISRKGITSNTSVTMEDFNGEN